MFLRKYTIILVTVFAIILSVGTAYSNGINPPRPSSATAVKAICKKSSGGRELEIYRTRIMGGSESAESLSFMINGVKKQIDIAEIRSITLNAGGVDPDGFVEGTLIRSDDTEEKPVRVQIKTKNISISLTGFRENGTRVNIDLTECKSIEFSSVVPSSSHYSPIMKK